MAHFDAPGLAGTVAALSTPPQRQPVHPSPHCTNLCPPGEQLLFMLMVVSGMTFVANSADACLPASLLTIRPNSDQHPGVQIPLKKVNKSKALSGL